MWLYKLLTHFLQGYINHASMIHAFRSQLSEVFVTPWSDKFDLYVWDWYPEIIRQTLFYDFTGFEHDNFTIVHKEYINMGIKTTDNCSMMSVELD